MTRISAANYVNRDGLANSINADQSLLTYRIGIKYRSLPFSRSWKNYVLSFFICLTLIAFMLVAFSINGDEIVSLGALSVALVTFIFTVYLMVRDKIIKLAQADVEEMHRRARRSEDRVDELERQVRLLEDRNKRFPESSGPGL